METPIGWGSSRAALKGGCRQDWRPHKALAAKDFLAAQDAFEGGDHDADGDVGQESVMNPVAGETDYQVDILHRSRLVCLANRLWDQ